MSNITEEQAKALFEKFDEVVEAQGLTSLEIAEFKILQKEREVGEEEPDEECYWVKVPGGFERRCS